MKSFINIFDRSFFMSKSTLYGGNFIECLTHLCRNNTDEQINTWLQNVQCGSMSYIRHLQNGVTPKGENRIRIMALLVFLGYDVSDYNDLPSVLQKLYKHIALNTISIGEIQSWCNISQSATFRLLKGGIGLKKRNRREMLLGHCKEMEERMDSERERFFGAVSETVILYDIHTQNEIALEFFAHMIKVITPMIEALVSDAYSPQDRARVRAIVGEDLFLAANMLGALCSETSRDESMRRKV